MYQYGGAPHPDNCPNQTHCIYPTRHYFYYYIYIYNPEHPLPTFWQQPLLIPQGQLSRQIRSIFPPQIHVFSSPTKSCPCLTQMPEYTAYSASFSSNNVDNLKYFNCKNINTNFYTIELRLRQAFTTQNSLVRTLKFLRFSSNSLSLFGIHHAKFLLLRINILSTENKVSSNSEGCKKNKNV